MSMRATKEPGWGRIGEWDSVKRRSLWMRLVPEPPTPADDSHDALMAWAAAERARPYDSYVEAIELCSGREGDDWFCRIERSNPAFGDLMQVLTAQAWSVTT